MPCLDAAFETEATRAGASRAWPNIKDNYVGLSLGDGLR